METEKKFCPSCKEIKPLSDFRKDKTKRDGLRSSCKKCTKVQDDKRKAERPEQYKAIAKRCREAIKKDPIRSAKEKAYRKSYHSKYYRENLYNLTHEEYSALLERQCHKCAICGKDEKIPDPNGTIRALAVDHDHTTGYVRGLLCFGCNTKLGVLENDIFVANAIPYLTNCNSNPEIVSILQNIQQYLDLKLQEGGLA